MTETMDEVASMAEADRILSDAGWSTVAKSPWNGRHVAPGLVGGRAPDGAAYVKAFTSFPRAQAEAMGLDPADYPDTYHEAAAWLVEHAKPKNMLSTDATLEPIAPTGLAEGADAEDAAQDEAHGEAGGDTDASEPGGSLSEEASIGEAESAPDMDNGMGSAESRSAVDESASVAYDAESPIDADFAEPEAPAALEGDDLAEPPALEFGAEMAEHEEAVDTDGGSVAYFGDDLPTMRLKKMGRLAQIAAEKTAAELAFANWSDDEFNAVQSHVVSNLNKATGAYTGDRQDLYNRFVELSEAQAMVATINRHRDVSIAYINAADTPRLMVEQFDPEAGWPG